MNKKIILSALTVVIVAGFALAAPNKKVVTPVNKKAVTPVKKVVDLTDKKIADINLMLEKGDYRGADKLIFQAINEEPGNINFSLLSAISLIMQDQLDSAQDYLDSLKDSAVKNSDWFYAQGILLLKRIDTSDMDYRNKREDLIKSAISNFEQSLALKPDNAKVYNAMGVAELKNEQLFKAETNFQKALEINPNYATALDNLGTIFYITNELDKAEPYFKKAEEANPSSATVYYHLAQVKFKQDDISRALYYANKSLQLNKRSTYAYNLIGEIYKKQGNEAAAITAFKKSIFVMPEYTTPYLNLARIYESRGDVPAALEELKTCYSISPDNDLVKLAIADLDLSSAKYDEAIRFYSMVSDKYKTEAVEGIVSAYYSLALDSANKAIFRSKTKFNECLVYIDEAIKRNPDNLELYLTKSKLNKLINNQVESKEVLLKIVAAPNSNMPDLLTKADAYIALQQYRDARNTYTQVIKTDKPLESDLYLAEYFTANKQFYLAKAALSNVIAKQSDNVDAIRNLAYINKVLEQSDKEFINAKYFKKQHDKFFQKAYLNKAIKINPNNIDANLMLGKQLKKEKDLYGANKCFKTILGASDDEKQIKKIARISRKLDKKIAKKEAKAAKKTVIQNENVPTVNTNKDILPVNNIDNDIYKELNKSNPLAQPTGI